eukprot:2321710-Karenia_brevis.AAC.1
MFGEMMQILLSFITARLAMTGNASGLQQGHTNGWGESNTVQEDPSCNSVNGGALVYSTHINSPLTSSGLGNSMS